MAKSLEAHDKQLKNIFSDEYQFEIPDYQRPYSWTKDQASELLTDLLTAMQDYKSGSSENAFYFLGSIVLIKADRVAHSHVVDGQQRLTTLSILFSALRVLLPKKAAGLTAFLYKEDHGYTDDDKNEYRLRAFEDDAEFFLKYIQEVGGIQTLAASTEKLHDSRKLMRDSAIYFLEELASLDEVELNKLYQFLASSCSMVVISTPNFDSAYRIFSVLNDRGLDLFPSDIIKAGLLGTIRKTLGEAKSKEYAQKWTNIERSLSRSGFVDLLGHIRMLYVKKKQNTILSKEFTEHVSSKTDPINLIDNIIAPYAEIYGYLRNQDFTSTAGAEAVNDELRHLDAVDWKDWMPPALVYFKKFKSQPKLVSEFLKRLERVSYYLLITKGGFNARLEKFRSLIEAIQRDDFDGDSSKLEAMHLSDKEMKDFREALNGDIYSKLPKARAALVLRLEKLMNDQSAIFEYRNVQIEQILPQRPAKNSDWLTLFADQEIRDDWTHRIANLAPLYSRKNPAASNYDFNKKKEVYFFGKDNTTSPFALINNLRGVEVWTPEVLEKRQKMLLDKLYKHWELNLHLKGSFGSPTLPSLL